MNTLYLSIILIAFILFSSFFVHHVCELVSRMACARIHKHSKERNFNSVNIFDEFFLILCFVVDFVDVTHAAGVTQENLTA